LFVYGAFLSSLGLIVSLFCRNATRATFWTLVTMLGLSGGPWLCGICLDSFLKPRTAWGARRMWQPETEPVSEWVVEAQKYGLTPPLTLAFVAFYADDISQEPHGYHRSYRERPGFWDVTGRRVAVAVFGLGVYAIAAWVLWAVARGSFTRVTGRMPLPPDRYLRGRKGMPRQERRPEVIAEQLPGGWG
jgi:hypothetical protein